MLDIGYATWALAVAACFFYGFGQWLLRERRKCFDAFKNTGVPGPPIDSLLSGNADAFWKPTQVESIGRWLKQYGDIFGFFLGDVPVTVIKNPDMIREIINNGSSNFRDRGHMMHLYELHPAIGASIGFARGEEWKVTRACMQQFFTPSKLKAVMPSLHDSQNKFMEILFASAATGAEVDITTLCERFTFDAISKAAFGIDTEIQNNPDNPLFQTAVTVFPNILKGFVYNTCQNFYHWPWLLRLPIKLLTAIVPNPLTAMTDKAKAVIEFRRQNPQVNLPDMAQILIDDALRRRNSGKQVDGAKSEDRAPLSPTEMDKIAANCMSTFVGGYDTTRFAITYWFYLMGKNPEIQEKMRKEALKAYNLEGDHLSVDTLSNLLYTNQVIAETLRMYPPVVSFTTRCAEDDYQCGGYLIRKGTAVMIPTYHLHHDPLLWTDPEKFDPERFSPENKHLINSVAYQPFGFGPHACIGQRFMLLEMASVTTQVLRHFRITLGPNQKDLELQTYALQLVPKNKVWIKLHRLNNQ